MVPYGGPGGLPPGLGFDKLRYRIGGPGLPPGLGSGQLGSKPGNKIVCESKSK